MIRTRFLDFFDSKKSSGKSTVEDVDQYHTGFAEWKGQLFSRLGVDKAMAWIVDKEGMLKRHISAVSLTGRCSGRQ